VVRALSRRDITEPFPVQQLVVRDALAGHDLLVQSPTGSGKTLAFGIPLVDRIEPGAGYTSALVLAPTRELAGQIVEELRTVADSRGLKLAAVYGGVGFGPQIKAARRADILVATPGRLEDLIARNVVSLDKVRILVLDEADRMLDMGFKPAVSRIVAGPPRKRQTLFFSATLEGATGQIATAFTTDARRHTQAADKSAKADIEHRFLHVDSRAPSSTTWSSSCSTPRAAAPWSSSAPSAAPTGWRNGSAPTTSRRSRCTATKARDSANAPWPGSRPARSRR